MNLVCIRVLAGQFKIKERNMITIPGYQIQEKLYESSNSLVFRGRKEADDHSVVLKVLNKDYPTPEELARFRREYEMTCTVEGEGVIRTHGLEKSGNTLVIILEDFGGESLSKLLFFKPADREPAVRRSLDLPGFLTLAIKVTEVLGQLHRQNLNAQGHQSIQYCLEPGDWPGKSY